MRRARAGPRARGRGRRAPAVGGPGGGCSGFTYEFTFEREARAGADDKTFRAANGAEVVVDGVSYEYVKGSTIDYVEEMIKSSFEVVKNPRAKGSCGCGASFDAEDA